MDLSGGPPPPRPDNTRHDNASGGRGPRGGLEQQKLDLLGPAYVLEQTRQRQYSRRRIVSAEELRSSIIQQEAEKTSGVENALGRQLFVIQGSPEEYLQILEDTLDIDPRFVEAYVNRHTYKPWVGRRRRQNNAENSTSFACFEFPELLSSDSIPPTLAAAIKQTPGQDTCDDGMGKPPPHVTCANGDLAVFCYASLWQSPKADVLLLDCPGRTQPPSRPENGPYRSSELSRASTVGEANGFRNNAFNNGNFNDQTASFETLLYESLAEEWREDSDDEDTLRPLIEDIAMHQWTEFFEALSAIVGPGSTEATVLYWQMQKSLERNLSNSEFYNKSFHPSSSSSSSSATSDWESLLSRLSRQVELSRHLAPPSVTTIELPTNHQSPQTDVATTYVPPIIPPRNSSNNNNSGSSAEDKNQHSLDRVSYMGGVLLPLSIVSSILSMSDPFGPGGSMFYVFWAVSVPLVLVTVFVIYADTIRRAEVWIEVAASGAGGSSGPGSDVENPEDLDHGGSEHGHDHHNGATTYSETVQLPVVEPKTNRIMGMAAFGDEYGSHPGLEGSFDEPTMMAQKTFRTGGPSGRRKWQKQQLGWKGACMTAFQLYRLKKGRPPNWTGNVRRERTN